MSDDQKLREITIRVRDRDGEAESHLEGPTEHDTAQDVIADVVGHLDSRSRGKLKHIPHTDR
jgi:hypothetical protein